MNSTNSQISADMIADVLGSVFKKGVRLWTENGQLHYKAPKGALTQEEIERLRVSRSELIAFLDRATGAKTPEPSLEPSPFYRAPLTFSQLAHWNLYRLSERCAIRQIASATRLRGPLSIRALQESVAAIVHRHDALRTRIVVLDGVPIQEIAKSGDHELELGDLTKLSESLREVEILRLIEQLILQPIDVAAGPLFGARLLRLDGNEYVLIVVMEHMISDAYSMGILLRDLFTAYTQTLKGNALSLPPLPVQFPDYAVRQWSEKGSWSEKHGEYWNERLAGCKRLRFPEDHSSRADRLGWGTVSLQIQSGLKAELREWCRLKRTTLVMSVFTAYVGLVLRWCKASESLFRYQSDGRVSPEIENTVGFFASAMYLRIALYDGDSFVDLMKRVTEEYCQSYEHIDFSYMAAQMPRPEFTRNTVFNWVPQGPKVNISSSDGSEDAITCSPIPFVHPMLKEFDVDQEPFVLLFDADDEIVGDVYFPLNRFSVGTMERFADNFMVFLYALLRQPERRVSDIVLLQTM